jgi:hypothetical protein
MKNPAQFTSLQELKARQAELSQMQSRLAPELISEAKAAAVSSVSLVFNKRKDPLKDLKIKGQIDIPGKFFSYLLPLIITKTVFRRSGFLTRIVIGIAARKVGRRFGPLVFDWLVGIIFGRSQWS